jgi:hypothetical protein
MTFRPALARGAALLAFAAIQMGTDAAAESIDLYGVTEASLAWAPASGPVVGYYVIVTRNSETAAVQSLAFEPRTTISGVIGDEVTVAVSAFDIAGLAGPISQASPTLRFNPEGGSPPPDDPPLDDPPPDSPGGEGPGTALDFDGDGVSDLLLRERSGSDEIVLWRMDASDVQSIAALAEAPPSWAIVGNGDYDGDGVADILWEAATGQMIIWRMRGGVPEVSLLDLSDLAADAEWHVGGSGDFDGDGHDDILLFSRILGESEIVYLRGGEVNERARLPGYAGAWSVSATDDVDGDGIDEIVWRDERLHNLVLWDMDGAGPSAPSVLMAAVPDWRVIGSGDFDGDGKADLYVQRGESANVQVWRLDGGTVTHSIELPGRGDPWLASGVGDYDYDARSDLVWFDPVGGNIEIWFSDGDGVTAEAVTGGAAGGVVVSGPDGSDDSEFRELLCSGDFNDDGLANGLDFALVLSCYGSDGTGVCRQVDMDSDGIVGHIDFELFKSAFLGAACGR